MKTSRNRKTSRALAGSIVALLALQTAHADSGAWNGTTDALWATSTNWTSDPNPVPGTGNTATFNNAGSGNVVISLGGGVTIGTIAFDTAVAAAYTIGSGAVNSETLSLDPSGAITMSATVAANQLFNAALVLGTGNTADAFTFTNDSATNSLTFAGGISSGANTGTKTLTVNGSGATAISGVISNGSGTAALTKSGAGTLALTGVNTYSGATTISSGTLSANSTDALGDSSATNSLIFTGGTLQAGGTITSAATRLVTLTSTGLIDTNSNAVSIAGVMSGAGGLTKTGAGTLTLSGTNLFSGAVNINGGTLSIAASANLGDASATNTLALDGGTLRSTGIGNVDLTANRTVALGAGGGTFDVGGTASDFLSLTGTISGTSTLTKIGTGSLSLAADNAATFSGAININNGLLNLAHANGLGTGAVTVNSGAILQVAATNANLANVVVPAGGVLRLSQPQDTAAGATIPTAPIAGVLEIRNATIGANFDGIQMAGGSTVRSNLVGVNYGSDLVLNGAVNFDTVNQSFTISGALSGASGAVNKISANTLTLSGVNTYTGTTTISAGTLTIAEGSIAASSDIVNNAALVYNLSTNARTYANVISGSGTLTKSGTNTLTLGGTNTFTGTTTISGGVLRITNGSALGSTAAGTTQSGTSALEIDGTGGPVIVGAEALSINGGGITNFGALRNIAGSNTYGGTVTMAAQSRINSDSGTLLLNNAAAVSATNLTLVVGGAGNITISGAIAIGSGGVSKADGAGTLTLSGTNTYTGATTVSAGILRATTSVQALGTGAATLSLGGGTLQLANDTGLNFARNTTVTATSTITSDTLTAVAGVTHTLGTLSIGAQTLNVAPGSNATGSTAAITFGATTISGTSSAATFSPALNSTLTLGTVTGTTPTITMSGTGSLVLSGTIATATALTINNGSVTMNTNNSTTNAALTVNSPGILNFNNGQIFGVLNGSGTINENGNWLYTNSSSTGSFSGTINGTGGYIKTGTGTQTLSGLSSYTGSAVGLGTTQITSGTLSINTLLNVGGGNSALGAPTTATAGVIQMGNAAATGTLIYTGAVTTTDRQIQIGLNSATPVAGDTGGATIQADGASNAPITFSAANFNLQTNAATGTSPTRTLTLTGSSTGANTISGIIQNNQIAAAPTAAVALTKAGAGTWVLSGGNTFTGGVTINAGILQLGNAGALRSNVGTENAVTFGASSTGTLALAGNSVVVANLSTNATPGTTFVQNANGSPVSNATLTVGNATNASGTYAGTIQDGTGGGTLALTKAGTGTLTLTGTNSYTGDTTISAGKLIMTKASNLGNGALNVGGNIFTYAPTAAGALNIGSGVLTLTNGSVITTTLGGTVSQSAITSTGAAALSGTGTININLIPGVAPAAGTHDLITAASGLELGTYNLGTAPLFNNTNFTVSNFTRTPGAISVTVAAATALSGNVLWKGGLTGGAGVWSATNGSTQSNWQVTDGVNQPLAPGATADLVFSASAPGTMAGMTLGANMTVRTITINNTATAFGLSADGNTLTITPSSPTTGITKTPGTQTATITAPVVLGASQTWTNNSAGVLRISSFVATIAAHTLTLSGTGEINFPTTTSGITGGGSVVVDGVYLNQISGGNQAANSYTGTTTVQNGGAILYYANNIGTGNINLNGGTIEGYFNEGFTRQFGTGSNQFRITGGVSGFGVNGSSTINFSNVTEVQWGSASFNPSKFVLGGGRNGGTTTFAEGIDLNGADRTVTTNVGGVLSALVRNTSGTPAGLIKEGAGTLSLTFANTYNGATTVRGGTLTLSGSGTLASTTALNLSGGGTLQLTNTAQVNRFADVAVSSDGGGITHNNTATNAINYTETLGALSLAKGQTNIVLSTDHTAVTGSQKLTFGVSGTGNLTQAGTSTITFSALVTGPAATKNTIAVFGATASGAGNIIGPWATVGTAANVQGTSYAAYDGSGNVVAATLTAATVDTDLASSTGNYLLNTGSLVTLGATRTVNALQFNGTASTLALSTFKLETNGLFLSGGSTNTKTVSAGAGGALTTPSGGGNLYITTGQVMTAASEHKIDAPITDNSGIVHLVKSGAGILILNGANTFTGNIAINAGTLRIGTNATANGANLNGGTYAGDIFIGAGANLDYQSNATQTLSGIISGDGNLLQRYIGTLTLGDDNTYTGKTTLGSITNATPGLTLIVSSFNSVNGGTPLLANSSLGAPTTIANGTIDIGGNNSTPNPTLRYTGAAATGETTDRVLNFTFNGGANRTLDASGPSGLLKFTSTFTGSGASSPSGTLVLTGTGLGEISGSIPEFYAGSKVSKTGGGTWTLSGANGFTGGMTLSGATAGSRLNINNAQALGTGTFTISGGNNATIGNTSGTDINIIGNPAQTWTNDFAVVATNSLNMGTGAVSMGGTRAITVTGAGTFTVGGVISGLTFGLTKSGSGTMVLSGANAYTGATSVTTGTLQLDGSTHASSTVGIATAGTLTGTGTVNGNATLTGGGIINKSAGTIAGTLGVTGGFWNGAGAVTGLVTSSSGVFNIGSGANLTANGNLNVTGGSFSGTDATSTLTGSLNYTSTTSSSFGGVIAGSGKTVTVNEATTTLTLGGTNTYTGATTVTAGTLVATSAAALGTNAAGTFVTSGATLDVRASIASEAIDVGGAGVGSTGALITSTGTGTVGGTVTLTGATSIGAGATGTLNINGIVTAGANTLTTLGTGVTTFGTTSTLTSLASLAVVDGTTNVNSALGTAGNAVVNVSDTAGGNPTKLRFGSVSQTLNSLTIGAGSTVIFTSGPASGAFSEGGGKAAGFGIPASSFGSGSAVVPEPGTIGLLLVGALGALNRRRRQA